MDRGPVGDPRRPSALGWGGWKQEPLQGALIQGLWQGPRPAGGLGPTDVLGDGWPAHAEAASDLAVAEPARPFETSHFSDLTHGEPLRRHLLLPPRLSKAQDTDGDASVAAGSKTLCGGGRLPVESVAALLWNQWQLSCGTGGSFGVESVAGFTWNRWQLWRGIRR